MATGSSFPRARPRGLGGELSIVVGRAAKDVSADKAAEHISATWSRWTSRIAAAAHPGLASRLRLVRRQGPRHLRQWAPRCPEGNLRRSDEAPAPDPHGGWQGDAGGRRGRHDPLDLTSSWNTDGRSCRSTPATGQQRHVGRHRHGPGVSRRGALLEPGEKMVATIDGMGSITMPVVAEPAPPPGTGSRLPAVSWYRKQ